MGFMQDAYRKWVEQERAENPNFADTTTEETSFQRRMEREGWGTRQPRFRQRFVQRKPPPQKIITEPPPPPEDELFLDPDLELSVSVSKGEIIQTDHWKGLRSDYGNKTVFRATATWVWKPKKGLGLTRAVFQPAANFELRFIKPAGVGWWQLLSRDKPELPSKNDMGVITNGMGWIEAVFIAPEQPGIVHLAARTAIMGGSRLRQHQVTRGTDVTIKDDEAIQVEPVGPLVGGGGGGLGGGGGDIGPIDPITIPEEPFEQFIPATEFVRLPELEVPDEVTPAISGLEVATATGMWGMDSRTAKTVVPEPKVRLAQNVVYREKGAFVKRNGYSKINNSQPVN